LIFFSLIVFKRTVKCVDFSDFLNFTYLFCVLVLCVLRLFFLLLRPAASAVFQPYRTCYDCASCTLYDVLVFLANKWWWLWFHACVHDFLCSLIVARSVSWQFQSC